MHQHHDVAQRTLHKGINNHTTHYLVSESVQQFTFPTLPSHVYTSVLHKDQQHLFFPTNAHKRVENGWNAWNMYLYRRQLAGGTMQQPECRLFRHFYCSFIKVRIQINRFQPVLHVCATLPQRKYKVPVTVQYAHTLTYGCDCFFDSKLESTCSFLLLRVYNCVAFTVHSGVRCVFRYACVINYRGGNSSRFPIWRYQVVGACVCVVCVVLV